MGVCNSINAAIALEQYYNRFGRNYRDQHEIRTFMKIMHKNDNKLVYSMLNDINFGFPMPSFVQIPDNKKNEFILQIIKYCHEHNKPPSNQYIACELITKLHGSVTDDYDDTNCDNKDNEDIFKSINIEDRSTANDNYKNDLIFIRESIISKLQPNIKEKFENKAILDNYLCFITVYQCYFNEIQQYKQHDVLLIHLGLHCKNDKLLYGVIKKNDAYNTDNDKVSYMEKLWKLIVANTLNKDECEWILYQVINAKEIYSKYNIKNTELPKPSISLQRFIKRMKDKLETHSYCKRLTKQNGQHREEWLKSCCNEYIELQCDGKQIKMNGYMIPKRYFQDIKISNFMVAYFKKYRNNQPKIFELKKYLSFCFRKYQYGLFDVALRSFPKANKSWSIIQTKSPNIGIANKRTIYSDQKPLQLIELNHNKSKRNFISKQILRAQNDSDDRKNEGMIGKLREFADKNKRMNEYKESIVECFKKNGMNASYFTSHKRGDFVELLKKECDVNRGPAIKLWHYLTSNK